MSHLVEKLREMEKVSASSHGGYWLFALFMPKDRGFGWDLVVSAPWLTNSRRANYELMSKFLSESLTTAELLEISRVVVLEPENPLVQSLVMVNKEHTLERIDHFENEEGQSAFVIVITAQQNPPGITKKKRKTAA